MARASTVAWMSVAVGVALAPLGLHAQTLVPPTGTPEPAQSRPARVHDALRTAMDAYRRGEYEQAATLFQQAQAGQQDLTPSERQDLVNFFKLNSSALKARSDGAEQIRRADEAYRQSHTQEAILFLKSVAPNQQFLTAADKQRFGFLSDKLMPGQTSSMVASGTGNATALPQARSKLKQARMLLAQGNYEAAQALAQEADRLGAPFQASEDTPQKVQADITRARQMASTPSEPKAMLTAARAAYTRGDLDEAERLAKQADQSSTVWSSMAHLWSDSPSKVLRDVANARAQKSLASTPPKDGPTTFTALKSFMGKNDNATVPTSESVATSAENTEKARQLLKQGRQALQAGNVVQARQCAEQARALKPELSWWEETPDKLLADIHDKDPKSVQAASAVVENTTPSDPRQMLRQARELYNAGKLEEAQTLAQKANLQPTHWGLFEDCPDKLLLDVRKARLKRDQEESVHVLAEARKQFEQGNLIEAERQAHRAERLHGPYSIWELGDRPQKLLAEIDTAKAKGQKSKLPPAPELAKTEVDKPKTADTDKAKLPEKTLVAQNTPPSPTWPDNKERMVSPVQNIAASTPPVPNTMPTLPALNNGGDKKVQARVLLVDARQLQKEGRLLEARQKAEQAQKLGVIFGPDEDRPELVLLSLSAVCQQRVDSLLKQANDTLATADPGRFRRAEADLNQARQLAVGFHLDTQMIDSKLAGLPGHGDKSMPPAPATNPPMISQMQHQEPAAAPVAQGAAHGAELLKQARMELRAGQTGNARRLAETAYSGPYGVQNEAAQVLRSIDAEEFNQRVITANHTFDAAAEAFHRQEYPQALTMLRSLDPQLLSPERQARLKEIMLMPSMQPNAVVQAGARTSDGLNTTNPTAGRAQATDNPAAASMPALARPPEVDLAKQVEAMQEVKFQKLRTEGLQAQTEAMRRFQAGDTDRALEILQDYKANVRDSGLDGDKVALLQRPVDSRLQQLKTLKHQRDFEKLQANQHDAAIQSQSKQALQEQAKKEQVASLMKQSNTLFKEAKYKEAEAMAARASELDPDDPGPRAAMYTARIQGNQVSYNSAKERRELQFVNSLNQAEDPGPDVNSDHPLRLDPAVTLLNKDRKALDLGNLAKIKSEKERAIYRRLDAPVSSLDYKDTPLKQILDDLQVTTGINIVPDEPALNEAGISIDKPVTMKLEGVALKSALNLLLHQVHLTYVVGDEVLKITTEDQARGRLVMKVHPVLDLIMPVRDATPINTNVFQAAGQMMGDNPNLKLNSAAPYLSLNSMGGSSAAVSQSQSMTGGPSVASPGTPTVTKENPKGTLQEELIHLIMSAIAPTTWREMGGQGTIDYYPLGMALVITQTPDIQEQVAELLQALRRLEDQQVAVEIRFITISENFFERIGVDFNINIRNDQSKYEQQLVSQQFRPFGFINHFTPNSFLTGLTPAGSFTQDLNIPIKTSSYEMAVPPFGAYPAIPGGNGGVSMGIAFLSDIEVYMFMEAAQGDQRSNVMQAPKLTLFNGQTSTITISDTQFFVTTVTVAQIGGQVVFVPNNSPFPTGGVTLTMNAVISADRRFVRMSLTPALTNLTSANVQLFPITTFITPIFEGGAVGQPVPFTQFLQQPVFNSISVNTTVNVPDGGTVLLGGMKRLSEGRNEFGPPILSKIPYINRLFKNVGYGRETESLMMMVTPRIIINEEEEQRQVFGTAAAPAPGAP